MTEKERGTNVMEGEGRQEMQRGEKMAAELCEAAAERERPGGNKQLVIAMTARTA